MKKLSVILFFFIYISNLFSSEREVLFWCESAKRVKGLESVLISKQAGTYNIEVYKTGRRWGTVEPHISDSSFNSSPNYIYTSFDEKVMVEIATKGRTPTSDSSYEAHFIDQRFGYDLILYCDYL